MEIVTINNTNRLPDGRWEHAYVKLNGCSEETLRVELKRRFGIDLPEKVYRFVWDERVIIPVRRLDEVVV